MMYSSTVAVAVAALLTADPAPSGTSRPDELETFSSVCEELPLPDEEEAIVIDVDSLRDAGEVVQFNDGTRIEVTRGVGGRINLRMVSSKAESCDDLAGLDEIRPIPMAEPGRCDSELADFQVRYADLVSVGRLEEAEALATEFLAGEEEVLPIDETPRHLPFAVDDSAAPILRHQVGYGSGRAAGLIPNWDDVSRRTITLRFRGARLTSVASFFELATGMPIVLDVNESTSRDLMVHLTCVDLPMADALSAFERVSGLRVVPTADQILISSPSE